MEYSLEVLETEDGEEWDDFVNQHSDSSFSHLFGWKEVLDDAYKMPSSYIRLRSESGLEGVLPLVHMKGPLAPKRLVSMPFLDRGGILADETEVVDLLLHKATEISERAGATGLDLRGPQSLDSTRPRDATRASFLLNLPESEEDLWKKIGPKVRNQIRKSQKAGVKSHPVEVANLQDFFRIFSRNMHDLGSPSHSLRFFRCMFETFQPLCRLYIAYSRSDFPVAGAIAISYRDTVTVPWASSLRSSRSDCPNYSLYWRIIRDAQQSKAKCFDFGRSTVGTGTYHFKKQWGTEIVPLNWVFLNNQRMPMADYYLRPTKSSGISSLWRRLPSPMVAKLGPWVRKQIPN